MSQEQTEQKKGKVVLENGIQVQPVFEEDDVGTIYHHSGKEDLQLMSGAEIPSRIMLNSTQSGEERKMGEGLEEHIGEAPIRPKKGKKKAVGKKTKAGTDNPTILPDEELYRRNRNLRKRLSKIGITPPPNRTGAMPMKEDKEISDDLYNKILSGYPELVRPIVKFADKMVSYIGFQIINKDKYIDKMLAMRGELKNGFYKEIRGIESIIIHLDNKRLEVFGSYEDAKRDRIEAEELFKQYNLKAQRTRENIANFGNMTEKHIDNYIDENMPGLSNKRRIDYETKRSKVREHLQRRNIEYTGIMSENQDVMDQTYFAIQEYESELVQLQDDIKNNRGIVLQKRMEFLDLMAEERTHSRNKLNIARYVQGLNEYMTQIDELCGDIAEVTNLIAEQTARDLEKVSETRQFIEKERRNPLDVLGLDPDAIEQEYQERQDELSEMLREPNYDLLN